MPDRKAYSLALLVLLLSSGCGAELPTEARLLGCAAGQVIPVVFIHGSELDSTTWLPMRQAFIDKGYPEDALLLVDLQPNDGDNVAAAREQIAPAVESLRAQWLERERAAGCKASTTFKVDLVTHSMGAFSGRWYAARIAPHRVRTFISIAGANHGTDALCKSNAEGNRQMCPAFATDLSRVQAKLNGTPTIPLDETPFGEGADSAQVSSRHPDTERRIRYFAIRIEPDHWIVPSDSAVLDGADKAPFWLLEATGFHETTAGNILAPLNETHDDLPKNSAVSELVVGLLMAQPAKTVE